MSQAWKLVEAEPIAAPKPVIDSNPKQDSWNKNRRGQSGARGGRRQFSNKRDGNHKGRRYYDDPYYGGIYIPDTPESRSYYSRVAVYNIEMLFSVENLCRDTFLRSYMDEAGFIPLLFICNYISCFGSSYPDILNILQESPIIEVDTTNETVRLKENWQMWLMPNGEGGLGLPLYQKQPVPPMPDSMGTGEYVYDYQTGSYYNPNQWYGCGEDGQGNYSYEEGQYVDANGQLVDMPLEEGLNENDQNNEDTQCEEGRQSLQNLTGDIGEVDGDASGSLELAKKEAMISSGVVSDAQSSEATLAVDN